MRCVICGMMNNEDARFCTFCGARLKIDPQTAGGSDQTGGGSAHAETDGRTDGADLRSHGYQRNRPNSGPQQADPAGLRQSAGGGIRMAARIAAFIIAVIFALHVFTGLSSVTDIFVYVNYGWSLWFCIVQFLQILVQAFGNAAMALAFIWFGLCLQPRRGNSDVCMAVIMAGTIVQLFCLLISYLLTCLSYLMLYGRLPLPTTALFGQAVWAVALTAVMFGLLCAAGSRPFAGMTAENMRVLFATLSDCMRDEWHAFRNRESADSFFNFVGTGSCSGFDTATYVNMRPMKENRSTAAFWLLVGLALCIYADYLLFKNMNSLSAQFNRFHGMS